MARLVELGGRRSGLEDFGLRMAEKRQLSNLGAVGLAIREQPTLRSALEMMANYAWLQNEALTARLEDTDEAAILLLDMPSWRGRHGVEVLVATAVRVIRGVKGATWRPLEVYFMHAAPANLEAHRRLFGVTPLFDQDFVGLAIDGADLDAQLAAADPAMAAHLTRYLDHLAGGRRRGLKSRVRELILAQLPGGGCTAERTAERLSMDRRTLHRRLAAEGTSFSALIQEARAEMAQSLLANSERPLQSVADNLGFASLSTFAHWFRRTFDCTASAWRAGRSPAPAPGLPEYAAG
jgi:AraC-like DNA-binding protein